MQLRRFIAENIAIFDGATGTALMAEGLKPGESPDGWNLARPDAVTRLHEAYLRAGANIIKANTFGTNALHWPNGGVEGTVRAALENAKRAVANVNAEDAKAKDRFIALDIGPLGKLLKPMGDLGFEEAYALFSETVRAGVCHGADCILIETMSDTYELKAAVLAAKEHGGGLPVFATASFDERARLLTGADPAALVALLEGLRVDALGVNCGLGPRELSPIVHELLRLSSLPVIVNPNAGLPRMEGAIAVYGFPPDEFASCMAAFCDAGVRMVGGCCGTDQRHIAALAQACRGKRPLPVADKGLTLVSSYTHAVEIGRDPIVIGERINPTGKPKLKAALKDGDMDYVIAEGFAQTALGAHVLDVNVGLPGLDEAAIMEQAVVHLQSVIDAPLQIDTASSDAMERALRIYNGKPLINSVNGSAQSMASVFPLVQRYGGAIIALPLDENGIPPTAGGRIAIAERILKQASRYGIKPKDIILDGLTMTVSAEASAPAATLETLALAHARLGLNTALGVSNVSFGLPEREALNAAFFMMAMAHGLNAAIINPKSEAMMKAYAASRALLGLDAGCQAYIASAAGKANAEDKPAAAAEAGALSLREAIERGLANQAAAAARDALQRVDPLVLIDSELVPALDAMGRGFEVGRVFLPQLLTAAEASAKAFEVIRARLEATGSGAKKGCVILATVKGDIHDIGKNIVRALLENYGYDVVDMGKDVSPEAIAARAASDKIRLVGLSALMTTTVPSMQQSIRLIKAASPGTLVMVGGAILTEEYAMAIGADRYCRDAIAAVHYAQGVFQG